MPEDALPAGVVVGSLEHILFITLTAAIDYQRDADSLWVEARMTYEDPETTYLFRPLSLVNISFESVVRDMQKHALSRKPYKDANIWKTIADTFAKKWQGNPIEFVHDCAWDAVKILERLRTDTHIVGRSSFPDYPYLRGKKIGPLWLRMLRDNVGVGNIEHLDRVPIPVDVHVARASLALGIVRGTYRGKLDPIYEEIREAWFVSTRGLRYGQRGMIALDVDKPLWNLSKFGCAHRQVRGEGCSNRAVCRARDLCVPGIISLNNTEVELDT